MFSSLKFNISLVIAALALINTVNQCDTIANSIVSNWNLVAHKAHDQDASGKSKILVRLDIYYDTSTRAHFNGDVKQIETQIKSIIGATQLLYRSPELRQQIEFVFRIVAINPMSGDYLSCPLSTQTVGNYLSDFGRFIDTKYKDGRFEEHADLALLVVHKNVWSLTLHRQRMTRVLGLAALGVFCSYGSSAGSRTLLVDQTGTADQVSAHELGHSLGLFHDGDGGGDDYESKCRSSSGIMAPAVDPDAVTWSSCSVKKLVSKMNQLSNCARDSNRWKTAPFRPDMDFSGLQLPFTLPSLDEQCKWLLGNQANFRPNSKDPCRNLNCQLDYLIIDIGTALSGTQCSYGSITNGICVSNRCLKP